MNQEMFLKCKKREPKSNVNHNWAVQYAFAEVM